MSEHKYANQSPLDRFFPSRSRRYLESCAHLREVVSVVKVLIPPITQLRGETLGNKTFVVTMRPRSAGVYTVVADHAEIHGEHLVLLDDGGRVAGLFLIDGVESWVELPDAPRP